MIGGLFEASNIFHLDSQALIFFFLFTFSSVIVLYVMITQGREEVRKGNAKIAFNVWEEKKSLIIKLYREEGWPLKQVIKMTCSHNFSPR